MRFSDSFHFNPDSNFDDITLFTAALSDQLGTCLERSHILFLVLSPTSDIYLLLKMREFRFRADIFIAGDALIRI